LFPFLSPPETPCAKTRTETPEPGFLESRFVIHPSLFGATVAWERARKSHSHVQKKITIAKKLLTEKTGSRSEVSGFLMTVGVSKAASSAAGVSVNRWCSQRSSCRHVL
jgi:hypothetical protein